MTAPASPARSPLVTVIIPTYQRPQLLPRAVDSVLGQTFTDLELLVVDDAQVDDAAAVMARYADPRVRYLRQPANLGVSAARNRGMREARGRYVAFLDDDDEWLPEKLERQVAVFEELPPEVGLVYTGTETVLPGGAREVHEAAEQGDLYRALLLSNILHGGGSNAMIRREVIAQAGYFDETLSAIEDHDYWLRASRHFRVAHVREPLIRYYNDRAPGDAAEEAERRSRDVRANLHARAQFYDRHGAEMRRAGVAHLYLLESARRHVVPSHYDLNGARGLARQAVAIAPLSAEAWLLVVRLALAGVRKRLAAGIPDESVQAPSLSPGPVPAQPRQTRSR